MAVGFPSVCYALTIPEPLESFLVLLDRAHFMVRQVFFYIGLITGPSDEDDAQYHHHHHIDDHSLVVARQESPLSTARMIKRRLPVIEFASFARRSSEKERDDEMKSMTNSKSVCVVCLCRLQERDLIRVLRNCSHVFHSDCLDKWVDLGQLTCPICRSKLLPQGPDQRDGSISWWVIERISCLFR